MREEFQRELKELHKELLKMGTTIEGTIDILLESFQKRDLKRLQEVIERDDIIDSFEYEIEKKCIHLILKQQPVAVDLRAITSILKMITDMERIADQCSDAADYMIQMIDANKEHYQYDIEPVINMGLQVKKMVSATIDCYVNLDEENAIKISLEDDIVDNYFKEINKQIQETMKNNSKTVFEGVCLLYIIKYLERMADHATNICEWIAYRVTGEHKQYN